MKAPISSIATTCLLLFFLQSIAHGLAPTRLGVNESQPSECSAAEGKFFVYSADYDFGETPPYSIKSKSAKATKKYLVRKVRTTGPFFLEDETPRGVVDEDVGSIIEYIAIGAGVIAFLCFFGALKCIWNFIKGQGAKDDGLTLKGILIAIAVFAAIAWVADHFAGNKITIDNATDQRVKVVINGDFGTILPAQTFLWVRIQDDNFDLQIETEKDGVVLETATLEGLGSDSIYNVCGRNSYKIDTKVYSVGGY